MANKVGMMHECKGHVRIGKAPSLQLDSACESFKTYHKFTNLYTGSSWM